jgi:hypothetical protein
LLLIVTGFGDDVIVLESALSNDGRKPKRYNRNCQEFAGESMDKGDNVKVITVKMVVEGSAEDSIRHHNGRQGRVLRNDSRDRRQSMAILNHK